MMHLHRAVRNASAREAGGSATHDHPEQPASRAGFIR